MGDRVRGCFRVELVGGSVVGGFVLRGRSVPTAGLSERVPGKHADNVVGMFRGGPVFARVDLPVERSSVKVALIPFTTP